MTEKQTYQNYSAARSDYDRIPSAYNARLVLRWANALAAISDEYDDLLDEARDIMADIIG